MPSSFAIPLHTPIGALPNDAVNIGTAFLAKYEGVRYLITAAHVPTKALASADWDSWPFAMAMILPDGPVAFPLFTIDSEGVRTPTFQFRRIDQDPGMLHDMMWFPMSTGGEALLGERLARHYVELDLSPQSYEDLLACHGYPPSDPWPQIAVSEGYVRGEHKGGLLMVVGAAVEGGYSGGPVVDPHGALYGMLIAEADDDPDACYVIPADVLRALIETTPDHREVRS